MQVYVASEAAFETTVQPASHPLIALLSVSNVLASQAAIVVHVPASEQAVQVVPVTVGQPASQPLLTSPSSLN